MIEDMKAKAQKFEEFMMQNMSKTKHSINNTIKTSKSTETDGDWKKSVRNIGVGTDGKINLEELENIHEKHQVILIIILEYLIINLIFIFIIIIIFLLG